MKNPAFYTASLAIGDCISATPTIRKLSEVYNTKVVVFSHHPDIFKRLPYVDRSEDVKDFITLEKSEQLRRQFDVHYSFWKMGQKIPMSDDRGIEMKHAIIDIRQYHAIDNGFTLLPHELHCDFVPDEEEIPDLPEEFVCLHPFKNWPSRTWDNKNWEDLILKLTSSGLSVDLIGKDSLDSNLLQYLKKGVNGKTDDRVFHEIEKRERMDLEFDSVIDLTNQTSLSQAWKIIDRAKVVVTMDSGILHLAGTTDTHIIQLGSSINPVFRAPYRKSMQTYKYSYVHGSCDLFCASNMKYSLRDWQNGCNGGTPIQCVTLIDTCLENKPTFECHPSVDKVFQEILKTCGEKGEKENIKKSFVPNKEELPYLIKIESQSLGDQIGSLSAISEFSKGKKVFVICSLYDKVFNQSYPEINFLRYDIEPRLDASSGTWHIEGIDERFQDFKRLQYKFDKPLIRGYADQLLVEKWERPKIDLRLGIRPIKNKYVCFSMHSTAQAKHWNNIDAWDKLCRMLRKEGITPVCIDRHGSFGNDGWWNEVPSSAVKKQGMDLHEMTNYIHHSEFFIGISSGLSWVAHALGKKVVMISGVTSLDNEFEEDTIRISNQKVCNGCINNPSVWFDPSDWLWCPFHKNTERQFECTKTITPEEVFLSIKDNLLI